MHKKLTYDEMYNLKCVIADAVLANKSDPENMTSEELRKVIAPLRRKIYKAMPRAAYYLLVRYYQWVHVEKRERRVIDGEEHNLNSFNLTGCADK